MTLIIYIWAVLALVVIGYVIYRLATDRRGSGDRHPRYPLESYPTDGMFPSKSEPMARLKYAVLATCYGLFLARIAFELSGSKSPAWLAAIAGPLLLVALLATWLLKRRPQK